MPIWNKEVYLHIVNIYYDETEYSDFCDGAASHRACCPLRTGKKDRPSKEGAQVHGTGWTELRRGYVRLPEQARSQVREALWNLSRNSSGLSLVFRSNTGRLVVKCVLEDRMQMFHMPATGVSGVDLFACDTRGTEHWCAPKFRPSFTQGSGTEVIYNYERLDYEHQTDIYTYRLYLPLYNSVSSLELTVDEDCVFEFLPVGDDLPVVVYGTSIAQGARKPSGDGLDKHCGKTLGLPCRESRFFGKRQDGERSVRTSQSNRCCRLCH